MSDRLLPLRALLFVVLFPGVYAVLVPFLILRTTGALHRPPLSIGTIIAGAVGLSGTALLLWSIWQFFAEGRGTLAPVDPPRELVVRGPYRFTRNPMYNGVMAMLLAASWIWNSEAVFYYALMLFCFYHLFVVFYEEPALRSRFADEYEHYRAHVPRWGVTFRPYVG
jgi:protein-S-isoprenylcysteine O-methyltransferase Ste14